MIETDMIVVIDITYIYSSSLLSNVDERKEIIKKNRTNANIHCISIEIIFSTKKEKKILKTIVDLKDVSDLFVFQTICSLIFYRE